MAERANDAFFKVLKQLIFKRAVKVVGGSAPIQEAL